MHSPPTLSTGRRRKIPFAVAAKVAIPNHRSHIDSKAISSATSARRDHRSQIENLGETQIRSLFNRKNWKNSKICNIVTSHDYFKQKLYDIFASRLWKLVFIKTNGFIVYLVYLPKSSLEVIWSNLSFLEHRGNQRETIWTSVRF